MTTSHAHHGHSQSFWKKYVFSTDHKVIGIQYLLTAMFMAFLGGFLSYLFRMQLAFPGQSIPGFGVLTPQAYNIAATMHGTVMIFWVAMPMLLAGFGNLLIPLMIGAEDMAFPFLNMLSFWVFFISTIVLITSFFVPGGAFAGGWTAYPPLSAGGYQTKMDFFSGLGGNLWILAVALEFVSFLMGGINYLVTSFNMRAPGLKWFRMPLVIWMFIIAVLIFMFSVGPLIAGAVMLLLDRTAGTGFYNPKVGGDPMLFQHLFWFFGHPEVYVLLLPAIGFVTEIFSVFSRKPIFGYRMIIYSTLGAGILSFVVWAHHQFVSGIDPMMANFFSVTTIMISVPFAITIFACIATLWKGQIRLTTPMLFAIGFIAEFLIGGVTGIYLGSNAFDIYAHGTYFVIAHFHFTLIPTVVFAGFAGVYYWYPKFLGKMFNETWGKIHFFFTTIFFNLVFIPLFLGGMAGEHRRIFDYTPWPSLMKPEMMMYRQIATVAAVCLIITQVIGVLNLVYSYFKGEKAPANPWDANTLEWVAPSPPPHGNFEAAPSVYRGAYEYSVPGREKDWWPQNVPS